MRPIEIRLAATLSLIPILACSGGPPPRGEAEPAPAIAAEAPPGDTASLEPPVDAGSFASGFAGVFEPYEEVRLALAGEREEEVGASAERMAAAARRLIDDLSAEAAGVDETAVETVAVLLPELEKRAGALASMTEAEQMRPAFAELSELLLAYRAELNGSRPSVAYCPMVEKRWLQEGEAVGNPYAGSEMAKCGEIESAAR